MYPVYSTANRNQGFFPTLFNEFLRSSLAGSAFSAENDNFNNRMMSRFTSSTPAVNISEDDKEYKVEVAAPGLSKEDFKISLDGDNIVIAMEHKTSNENSEAKAEDKKYIRKEFFTPFDYHRNSGDLAQSSYSMFKQTFTLPDNIERQQISAKMTDGILTIDIPKMTEQEKVQETQFIEIK